MRGIYRAYTPRYGGLIAGVAMWAILSPTLPYGSGPGLCGIFATLSPRHYPARVPLFRAPGGSSSGGGASLDVLGRGLHGRERTRLPRRRLQAPLRLRTP